MDTKGNPLGHPNETQLDPAIRMHNGSCMEYIPVYSDGIWDKQWQDIFQHPLALLQFQLVLIFLISTLLHYFIGRLHLPRMISDILAGMLLGPSLMRRLSPKLSDIFFPPQSLKVLLNLTRFGYLLFMFMIGVKMDANLVTKSGKKAWIIASLGVVIPYLVVGIISVEILSVRQHDDYYEQEWVRIFVGLVMITSFPVVACLLMHLKILNTELGCVALSSALVSDLLSIFLINGSNFQRIMLDSQRTGLVSMFLILSLVVAIWTVFRSMMLWIIRQTPEEKHVKSTYVFWIIMTVLLVQIFGDNVGLSFLYGPFLLGLSIPTGPPLASSLVEKLDTMISGLFLPLVSFYCGYKSDIWVLGGIPSKPLAFISFFGMPAKFFSCLVTAICCKMPLKDATGVALILCAKGIVELGTLANNMVRQPIDAGEFAMTVLTVLVVATVVPTAIRGLYDPSRVYAGYQKRDIQHLLNREGLKILACAFRQDDATAAYKLLECCSSTKENPVYVYVLNLEELKGGSAPLLINHQLGQKTNSSKVSTFHPVIDVFNFFKMQKSVQVQVYTAISPLHLMDEDICWLAFDQSVSFVILPCHRKWDVNGKLVLESSTIQNLNNNVLKKAPCSVGILIDRRSVCGATSILTPVLLYRVAMLHMGGEDDIESLAYAKQMARCSSVQLTVIRFVALESNPNENGWSKMLVDECLRDIKRYMISNPNVEFREEMVRDGVDTARIIQSIEMEFDLIIVGRRHKSDSPVILGLSEWVELPELGPIGDILAASDLNTSVSVLVVQQQII